MLGSNKVLVRSKLILLILLSLLVPNNGINDFDVVAFSSYPSALTP